ncbi:MAG: HAMP domain-containing sensor histidine kinase [Erysipelotrichaceae bacterium]
MKRYKLPIIITITAIIATIIINSLPISKPNIDYTNSEKFIYTEVIARIDSAKYALDALTNPSITPYVSIVNTRYDNTYGPESYDQLSVSLDNGYTTHNLSFNKPFYGNDEKEQILNYNSNITKVLEETLLNIKIYNDTNTYTNGPINKTSDKFYIVLNFDKDGTMSVLDTNYNKDKFTKQYDNYFNAKEQYFKRNKIKNAKLELSLNDITSSNTLYYDANIDLRTSSNNISLLVISIILILFILYLYLDKHIYINNIYNTISKYKSILVATIPLNFILTIVITKLYLFNTIYSFIYIIYVIYLLSCIVLYSLLIKDIKNHTLFKDDKTIDIFKLIEKKLRLNSNTLFNIIKLSLVAILYVILILLTAITGSIIILFIIILLTIVIIVYISINYSRLLKLTTLIANGEILSVNKDNLGIFNECRDNLRLIKQGLEIAIKEEIKASQMKTELISNVSHDLKTPLTSIINYTDLLDNTKLDDEQKEYLKNLKNSNIRLKNLIDDLFEISKASSGNIILELIDLDIAALLEQTIFELDDKLKKNKLKVITINKTDKSLCNLDPNKTYRIFSNIIDNAIKYSLDNTRLYIVLTNDNNFITLEFKNISRYEIDFDPSTLSNRFTRADKSRSSTGSGLGLAIVKSFIELQGGTLSLTSDGDLFKVVVNLPLSK